jgi:3-hydroxybutyryl-CoA dehydrogenase
VDRAGVSKAIPRDATVAVIGAGAMGCGIAQVAAQAGHPVRLFDTRLGAAERARASIADALGALVAKGRRQQADARPHDHRR